MAFLNKVKNLFRGGVAEKKLPTYIQVNINPKDHWNIIGELGDGAFGKVEKAVSKSNPRQFAASKSIEIQEGEELEDFLVEIEILTQCKGHPVMLGLYSCYFFDNKLTMMLEFCGGGAVDNIMIELEKALTEPQIRYIGHYVCEALRWIHSQNVIHRDLKAGNILLTNDGQVRLADFGVSAKLKSDKEKRDTFIGTPYWMAPEVMMCETFKDQPYDSKADIWSFGITLIEMAQMEPPHSEVSPMRVLIKVQKSPPPTLDDNGGWSIQFKDFLKRCLNKAPNNRESADALNEHQWLRNAPNERKHILMLLAEMQADVREEVIIDADDESMAGSEDNTQRIPGQNDSWSSASDSPLPMVTPDVFKHPVPTIETPPPEAPKKRAAPPPPQEAYEPNQNGHAKQMSMESSGQQTTKISQVEITYSPTAPSPRQDKAEIVNNIANKSSASYVHPTNLSLNLSASNSPKLSDQKFVSPGREALDILDDLNITLEAQQGGASPTNSYSDQSPAYSEYPNEPTEPVYSKQLSPKNVHHATSVKIEPEHTIRDIINVNREKMPQSPQLSLSSDRYPLALSSSNESVSMHGSIHKSESRQSVNDNVFKQPREKIVFETSPNKVAVNHIRTRFESVDNDQDLANRHSMPTGIPEGLVKNKMAQVLEEQQSNLRNDEASRISQERREQDAMFSRKPVEDMAASFVITDKTRGPNASLSVSAPATPQKMTKKTHAPNNVPTTIAASSPQPSPVMKAKQPVPSTSPVATTFHRDPEYFEIPYTNKVAEEKKAPPPEPPVDYVKQIENNRNTIMTTPPKPILESKPAVPEVSRVMTHQPQNENTKPVSARLGGRRDASRQTVTKKTRTYMIDGVQVTSTTVHVLGVKDDKVQRKQQLHDLRRLQRDEARQKQELQAEGMKLVEEQAKKFMAEQQILSRTSELEMDSLERKQRKEIEEAESSQENEMKIAQKRLRIEQEKDMRAFKERMKQEMKIIKKELDMLSRNQRKEAIKLRKDQIDHENQMKEEEFMMQLHQNGEAMLQRVSEKHKERMASMEKQFLMQKHLLLRAKENSVWELEDKQMREKYVLHRKLFKDEYYLLRTQMLARHQREMQQIEKMHQEEEEELIRALTLDRKKLPKMLRAETKTRSVMFKESLRISMQNMSSAEMQERIRRFDEQEALRMRAALEEHDTKSQKKLQAVKERHQEAVMELDEMQNEKRKQLLEKEKNTMGEHEKKYYEMREMWQEDLIPRKTMLEQKFQEELDKQEMFYGVPYSPSQASTLSARHIP